MNAQETTEIRNLTEDEVTSVSGAANLKEELRESLDYYEYLTASGSIDGGCHSRGLDCSPTTPHYPYN
jgi:hypothetical protein